MNTVSLLSASVTPVVFISACGLVLLALYNRLNAILARIRAFHHQKIDLLKIHPGREGDEQQRLLDLIDSQILQVTGKARTIQKGLYCLLSAVLAFLACSFLAAAAVLHDAIGLAALAAHALGLLLFVSGIGWALRELTLSLVPLEEESAYLATLSARGCSCPAPADAPPFRPAKIA